MLIKMKKINGLLMVAIAFVLFSCGNGKGTKTENNQDSTSITQNAAIETTNNIKIISSFELKNKLISNRKNIINEYSDKTILLTDLLVYGYEIVKYVDDDNEYPKLCTYAFDSENFIAYLNSSNYEVFKLNGVMIDNSNEEKDYFKRGDSYITIELKNKEQLNSLKMLDKSISYLTIKQDNNFEDLIKVKGTIVFEGNNITLKDGEIIE